MRHVYAALACLLLSLATVPPARAQGVGGSAFHKNDITYSMEVVTPHIDWAAKLPGGPIKGFFIPSVAYGRDMVELMQRLDLSPTTVSIDRDWDVNCWGIGDYYSHRYRGDRDDFTIVYGYVEQDLTGPEPFEVMLIPGLHGWSRLTRPTRDAILKRVEEGAGLVLLHPFVGDLEQRPFAGDEPEPDTRIWEISPLVGRLDDYYNRGYPERNEAALAQGKWEIARPHFITEGLALDLLPEGLVGGESYKYRANGDVLVKSGDYPVIAVRNYGRGRVVALAYLADGFIPTPVDPFATRIYWDYWEQQYSLLARCIVWAAGRDSGVSIARLAAGPGEEALRIDLDATDAREAAVQVTAKSEFGHALGSYRKQVRLSSGVTAVSVPASAIRPPAGWPGGRRIFDVIVRDPETGATLNWGATSCSEPKRARITKVECSSSVCQRGDALRAAVTSTGDLEGMSVHLHISDDMDRLLTSQAVPAAPEREFSYRLSDFLGGNALVTAELVDGAGAVVDQFRAAPVLVVQDRRREKEYHPILSFGGGRHYFRTLRRQLVRAAGADTGFVWGGAVNNSLDLPRGSFGVYHYDRGPTTDAALDAAIAEYERTGDFDALQYNTKVALYRRTSDKRFLTRTPCFDDPDFMQRLAGIARDSAEAKRDYNFDYYFVGDEGSLTSYGDAVDFCWGPHTLAGFRQWLQQEYGSLDALNRQWRTTFTDWDSVVPYTPEEAKNAGSFAPWADHRTYMEIVFARAYQTVRDAVVAADPEGHIAVSGTQATNAYNGCDWYRLDQVIDDFLSYGGGNQWDLHRSFAKPGAVIGFWTGYGSSGLGVQNAIWSAALHNVLHPSIFWMYSYLNPDFTYSKSARDMGEAFKSLRLEGVGKLLMESERLHDGIALHFSMPSVHGATITGYHARRRWRDTTGPRSFPSNRDGWVRLINDLGLQFEFVASEQIAQGKLAGPEYRVLILPFSIALSAEEAEAIRSFVQRGGILIADAAAGMMDEHCTWVEDGILNDLFGISPASSSKRSFASVEGQLALTEEGRRWPLDLAPDALAELEMLEPVKATTGTALMRIGEADAVVVRRVGSGWAVYLNLMLDQYSRGRRRGTGLAAYRTVVGAILSRLGVAPAVQVFEPGPVPLTRATMARYQLGDSLALAIVKDNVGIEGQDGVTVYDDALLGRVLRQDITIKLPRTYHVADVRTGEMLGYTDTIDTSILVGGALVLGLSESEGRVSVSGPQSAALGEHPEFTVEVSAPRGAVVRCHFSGPDGSLLPAYCKNLLIEGNAGKVVLPSALNDPAGDYTLRVTDVITGASAETTIRLQ